MRALIEASVIAAVSLVTSLPGHAENCQISCRWSANQYICDTTCAGIGDRHACDTTYTTCYDISDEHARAHAEAVDEAVRDSVSVPLLQLELTRLETRLTLKICAINAAVVAILAAVRYFG